MGKFVYFYGLLASTVVLFGSFFVPAPYKYLQLFLLSPFVVAYWLSITNPKKVTEATWSLRIIILTICLTAVGGGLFYLAHKNNTVTAPVAMNVPDDTANQAMAQELAQLKAHLSENQKNEAEKSDVTGLLETIEEISTPTPKLALGKIKITNTSEVDVYEEANESSRVVGIAAPQMTYSYFEQSGNWFYIDLGAGVTGWAQSANLTVIEHENN